MLSHDQNANTSLQQEIFTFEVRVLSGNPLQRFGSRSEPDPEPTREFEPIATTGFPPPSSQQC